MRPTPYYECEGVTLYCGDALAVLPTLDDGSVDAIVTDPPYNVGYTYSEYNDKRSDYESWCRSWFTELKRVCSGPIAISCGHVNLALWCRIAEPDWVICWWKPAAMGRSPLGVNNWEPVLLYGKSPNKGQNDVIRATIKVRKDTGEHPCPKPLEWARGLIETLTTREATVLDPFVGSGTTLVAASKAGRTAIGIEGTEAYCAIAARRCEAARTPLFDGAPPCS